MLLSQFNIPLKVHTRTTISKRILSMEERGILKIRAFLHNIPGKESIINDAWKSEIFRGYMEVIMHLIKAD